MVTVDKVGAIFMAGNVSPTSCTKHMDIRYKYVNRHVGNRIIEITFVESAMNDSSILTRN